jgi:S1-C subfamily serine protease
LNSIRKTVQEVSVRNKWVIFVVLGLLLFSSLACNLSELTTLVNEPPSSETASQKTASSASPAAPATVVVEVTPTPGAAAVAAPQVDIEEQRFIDVYARVSPAVVCITAPQQFGECIGSGFVIDTEGHIVTNNHVATAADELLVTLADEHTVAATVVGTDPGSDLAVLKIDVPTEELTVAELGESSSLKVGQRAIAIGNPFGLERTMTTGIISSLGRTLSRTDSNFQIAEVIQTDAAINPGNSGGPLLDTQGKVIGINSAIFSTSGTSSGVGFAIPVDIIKRVVPELMANGHYRHTWLGVSGQTISPEVVDALNLPVDNGVLLFSVEPGSPAEQAGLRGGNQPATVSGVELMGGGDIIVAINDVPVKRF